MKRFVFVLTAAVLFFAACKKTQDLEAAPRIFRPVLAGSLVADSNTIVATWLKMDGVKSYRFEMSRDTFRTIEKSVVLDTNTIVLKKLLFNQLYQLRVKSLAPDTAKSSGWSNLGGVKTLSSILKQPGVSDITFNSVRVSWTTKGAPVSSIKIITTSDSAVVAEKSLTATDRSNENKVINGLVADTKYTILLYSGTDVRGNVDFATKASFAGVVIDLTDITGRPSVLTDTLPIVPSGSTILLKRGETYNIAATASLSKSVTIMSGPDLTTTAQARIYLSSNFVFDANAAVDLIEFNDVYLYGAAYGSSYVFNQSGTAAVAKLRFANCKAEIFRGFMRLRGATTINNLVIDNCIIDSLSGYGLLTVDDALSKVEKISIINTTIYKAEKLITSSKIGSTAVLIDNCTVNEAPNSSSYYVDYGSFNVSDGITVTNSIFGTAKANPAGAVRGVRAGSGTTISATNNFRTADNVSGGSDVPNINTYNRISTELWQDPRNGNFIIADNTFPGRGSAGDPRWR